LLLTTTFVTALALAMDAVAVAIASGLSVKTLRFRDALKMALFFGAFQGVMPLFGYLLGLVAAQWLIAYNHWIAFVILLALGIKMIHESRTAAEERVHSPFRTRKLLVLAVATSLDAFAVGIGFSLLNTGLIATVTIIGLVTFALCLPAVWFGARLGKMIAKRAEVFGGVVLIVIGSKILLEHLISGT
jgi:putative Mn2+ efflux pump MntP